MIALFKHAKNFVSKSEAKPLFNGIHFDGKRAMITNTCLAIVVDNIPFEKQTVHYKTGAKIAGNFPDIDKVIPKETAFNTDFTDINQFLKALKIANSMNDIKLKFFEYNPPCWLRGNEFGSKNNYGMEFTANLTGLALQSEYPKIYFNGKYMYDILNFFKDYGVTKFSIKTNHAHSAFMLTTDNGVMALLTPIRVEGD